MKIRSLKWLIYVVIITFLLGTTACGGNDNAETKDTTTEDQVTDVSEEVEVAEDADVLGKSEATEDSVADEDDADAEADQETVGLGVFETIADYVNSDIMQSQISSIIDSLEGTGIQIDIYGEDNKLVYAYTYEDFTKDQLDAAVLKSSMDSQADTFSNIAKTLKAVVKEPDPVVKVMYLDANGEEICSVEFDAAE